MKFVLLILVTLFAWPNSGALAQGKCPPEFAACMDKCAVAGGKDPCIGSCQTRMNACAAAVWTTAKPSYEDLKRPPHPNDGSDATEAAAPAQAQAKAPAKAKAEKAERPSARPVKQQ